MQNVSKKKPAGHGGHSLDVAGHGEQSEINLRSGSCGQDHKKARALGYTDLEYIRDLVDLFGAGQFASDRYRRGRLSGLAVCLYSDRIEVFGPLCDEGLDLQAVDWLDDDLPALGWRDSATNTLFRIHDASLIAHLAAEAREAAERRERVLNLFNLDEANDADRRAQVDGMALRNSSRTGNLVDMVCDLAGYKLVGLVVDEAATAEHSDEEAIVYSTDQIHWMKPGNDEVAVLLKTSRPQRLSIVVRHFGEPDVEHVLARVRDLGDLLGDRIEATGRPA